MIDKQFLDSTNNTDPYWDMTTVDKSIIRSCGLVPAGNFSQRGMIKLLTRLSEKYDAVELNLCAPHPEFPAKRNFIWKRYSFYEVRTPDIILTNRETGKNEVISDLGSLFDSGMLSIRVQERN
jgi:hypothetical protein